MKFAKALTLALLLDGTLTATASQLTIGVLTPLIADRDWIAKRI